MYSPDFPTGLRQETLKGGNAEARVPTKSLSIQTSRTRQQNDFLSSKHSYLASHKGNCCSCICQWQSDDQFESILGHSSLQWVKSLLLMFHFSQCLEEILKNASFLSLPSSAEHSLNVVQNASEIRCFQVLVG